MDPKAIPTNYNRIQFRSRSEAKWAVFFDLLSLKWEYEPEKMFTGASRYIPDFLLEYDDDNRAYFEVKGPAPTMVEYSKLANVLPPFKLPQKWHGFIAHGPISELKIQETWLLGEEVARWLKKTDQLVIGETRLIQCPMCGIIGFSTVYPSSFEKERSPHELTPHYCEKLNRLEQEYDVQDFLEWDSEYAPTHLRSRR